LLVLFASLLALGFRKQIFYEIKDLSLRLLRKALNLLVDLLGNFHGPNGGYGRI
jgi:hypothetical protein